MIKHGNVKRQDKQVASSQLPSERSKTGDYRMACQNCIRLNENDNLTATSASPPPITGNGPTYLDRDKIVPANSCSHTHLQEQTQQNLSINKGSPWAWPHLWKMLMAY
jgi:hypothetical protein